MLFPVPDSIPDEVAVFADPLRCRSTRSPRHAARGGKLLVYGAGALGSSRDRRPACRLPDVEVGVVARFGAQADLARDSARTGVATSRRALIEAAASGRAGAVVAPGCRSRSPAGDVVYDTVSKKERSRWSIGR